MDKNWRIKPKYDQAFQSDDSGLKKCEFESQSPNNQALKTNLSKGYACGYVEDGLWNPNSMKLSYPTMNMDGASND